MDPKLYKNYHENFMKNNNGTTIEETFLTILPTFFTTFIVVNLLAIMKPISSLSAFIIEFTIIVLSLIFNLTILHYRIWEINYTLLIIVATSFSKQLFNRIHLAPFIQIPFKRPASISVCRAVINIITAVCILAVDFKIFPRKLAKTETFGFGLMDSGVGLFVYGNAIVAPEVFKTKPSGFSWTRLQSIVCSCLPLFLLGIARFIIVNEIDYQQHISEYGVHWNFFLTLAFTKIFGTIILSLLPKIEYSKYVAIILLLIHETLLQIGLEDYVINLDESAKRNTFINANREGICSLLGYTSLYIASIYIGSMAKMDDVPNDEHNRRRSNLLKTINARELTFKAIRAFVLSLILWKLAYALRDLFGVSRRLANMGYVIWVLSIGTTMSALFIVLEIFYYFLAFDQHTTATVTTTSFKTNNGGKDDDAGDSAVNEQRNDYVPIIFNAINYNGLAFFLGANLLTGLVNIVFQTLLLDKAVAVLILIMYMLVLLGVTTFLYLQKIQLKVW